MGRGNAFTSPTYNKDKYSLKEKLKIDFKNSLMSERGTKRFSKVQVFVLTGPLNKIALFAPRGNAHLFP